MTTKAFVLIEVTVGRSKDVVTALKQIKGVSSVDTVTGPYDAIIMVEAGSLSEVGDIVTKQIHPIIGISRTVTCLVI